MTKPIDKLLLLVDKINIAEKIDEEKLKQIGEDVVTGYEIDRDSRREWEKRCEEAIKFCKQIVKNKNFPWKDSSNVVYPLLTIAANAFAARTYPEIVKDGDKLVKFNISGEDPENAKQIRANRLSAYISWQLLVQGDSWETDLDKLLHQLPIVGTCFRKQYYDTRLKLPQSDLCSIMDIVVNNLAPSLDKAPRITHRMYFTSNDIIERIRSGLFLDIDVKDLEKSEGNDNVFRTDLDSPGYDTRDIVSMYEFVEQHTFLDLDGDGYQEPYIVVVHLDSKRVLGLYKRFDELRDVALNDKEEILYIKPKMYFTDYHFIHDPDGGFYSLGFGHILFPVNKAINSLINQLIDAGTLANTSSGIISKQLRLKGGNLKLNLGEYVQADAGTTGRIADSIYQFQFKDPSAVLFQLLGLLIDAAEKMASINDVMTGQALPQNSPSGSTAELSQNGLKVFNSISLRLYRSLKKEFKNIFCLDREYADQQQYFNYSDSQLAVYEQDFEDESLDICPVANPQMDSSAQKMLQANSLLLLMQNPSVLPFLNIPGALIEYFRSLGVKEESITQLVVVPDPNNQKPSPEEVANQIEAQQNMIENEIKMEQETTKRMGLQIKADEIKRKYDIKKDESQEKEMKMLADSDLKRAQVEHMDRKLDIEEVKARAALRKSNSNND
jgi:chaperonin GroES